MESTVEEPRREPKVRSWHPSDGLLLALEARWTSESRYSLAGEGQVAVTERR